MSDVFISYAREDAKFVRALQEALESQGREAWVDWKDIPPTAEWMAEIQTAIDAADTFLFVISPDSVASETCRKEVAHAADSGKRLVPLVRRDVEAQDVPQVLAALNWIFVRESDDFDSAIASFLGALDTDLEWVREHTRLLVRAREWEKNNREKSYMLNGRDLEAVSQSLAAGLSKSPRPTQLQVDYVAASREAATKRQRVVLGSVIAALIVTAGLAVFAWTARMAEAHERKLATARHLVAASEAGSLRGAGQHERSALLAVEAMRRFAAVEQQEVESAQALRQALRLLPRRLHPPIDIGQGAAAMAFTEDGTAIVFAAEASQSSEVTRLSLEDLEREAIQGLPPARRFALSPAARYLAIAKDDLSTGELFVIDLQTNQQFGPIAYAGQCRQVAVDPYGSLVAVTLYDETLIMDVVGETTLARIPRAVSVAFDPDGTELSVAHQDGAERWAIIRDDGRVAVKKRRKRGPRMVRAATYASDGGTLGVASGYDGSVHLAGRSIRYGRDLARLAIGPGGRLLVVVTGGGPYRIVLHDAIHDRAVELGTRVGPPHVAFSPRDNVFAVADKYGRDVEVWEVPPGAPRISGHRAAVVFSPDEERILTATWSHERDSIRLQAWRRADGEEIPEAARTFPATDFALHPHEGVLAVGGVEGARVVDLVSGDERALAFDGPVVEVALSADGEHVAAAGSGAIVVWELATGKEVGSVRYEGKGIRGLFVAPPFVQAGVWPPKPTRAAHPPIVSWRLGNPNPVDEDALPAAIEWERRGSYSDGGRLQAQRVDSDTVAVRDPSRGNALVARVDVDSLLTDDGQLILSRNGRFLATAGDIVHVYVLDHAELDRQAGERLSRNLTTREWQEFFGDEPYRKTFGDLPGPND